MKKLSIYILISLTIILPSCNNDFGDINKDPYNSLYTDIGPLFNNIIKSLQLQSNEQFYVNNEVLYKQTQLAALTSEAWSNLSIGTEEIWNDYYRALVHFRDIDNRLIEKESLYGSEPVNNIRAMLKIVMGYKTLKITDLFGDMPYSEAAKGFEDLSLLRPAFDKQEDIYKSVLNDLKWAVENLDVNLENEFFSSFLSFDNFFQGDLNRWIKFANSIRLRHAMRISSIDPELAGEIIKEIIENNLPVLTGYNLTSPVLEYVGITPRDLNFTNNAVHWSFREHKNLRMGSNIWHQMSFHDSTDGSGIFDLRAFIFFETNNDTSWVAYPQIPLPETPSAGGIPYNGSRDANYYIKGADCIYSPFNYYLIRDQYDIPELLITGAEVHFIIAEAYLRGIGVAIDETHASNEFMSGIMSSVDLWKQIVEECDIWEHNDIPSNLGNVNVVNQFGFWNATTIEEKLELLYTQRMIDAFRQPNEAYSLARRTMMTPREGDPINHFRLPYPPSESQFNPLNYQEAVTRMGGDFTSTRIWWNSMN